MALVGCIFIHIETYRLRDGIANTTFAYSGRGPKRVNQSKSQDRFFHDHNSLSHILRT
jgi:hypothetical protein